MFSATESSSTSWFSWCTVWMPSSMERDGSRRGTAVPPS